MILNSQPPRSSTSSGCSNNARGAEGSAVHGGLLLRHPPPPVTNEVSNILGRKGLLFVEGEGTGCRGSCCCRLSRTRVLRGQVPGFDLKITEKMAGVMRASRSGAGGGGGDGEVVLIGAAGYKRLCSYMLWL